MLIIIMLTGSGCATNKNIPSMDKYTGSSGVLYKYYTNDDRSLIDRVTNYCASIGMGSPPLNKIQEGCLFCSNKYNAYEFTCLPGKNTQASNYIQYSRREGYTCNIDSDCYAALKCLDQTENTLKTCRPDNWVALQKSILNTKVNEQQIQPEPLSLEGFKTQCKQLGFKVGTPDFGNCVLELNDAK